MSDKLKFTIGADLNELDKALSKASSSVQKFTDDNKKKFEEFSTSLIKVGAKFSILSGAVAGAVGGMAALAKSVGNTADRLLDLADITGATTDQIQEWQYVAKIAGVNTETYTNAVEGLTRRLKETGEQGSIASQVLSKIGISTRTLSGELRNGADVVNDTILRLSEMENVTERNSIGAQVFGGAWKDVAPILSLGADGIEKLKSEAGELGLIMSGQSLADANAFRQGMVKLNAQMEAMKNQIGAKLAPMLTNTLVPAIQRYVIPALQKMVDFVGKVINWFQSLDPTVKKIITIITGMVIALGPLLVALGGLLKLLPLIGSAMALLTGPIGLIIAGVVALTVAIVKNWKTVRQWAEDVVNYFIRLYNQSIGFRAGVEGLILSFKNIFSVVKFVFKSIVEIVTMSAKQIIEGLKTVGELLVAVFTLDFKGVKTALEKGFTAGFENIKQGFTNIGNEAVVLFNEVSGNIQKAVTNTLNGSIDEVSFAPLEKKIADATAEGVRTGLEAGLSGQGGRGKDTAVGGIGEMVGVTELQGAQFSGVGISEALKATKSMLEVELEAIQLLFQELNENVNLLFEDALAGTITDVADTLGRALAGGGNIIKAIGQSLLQSMGKLLSNLGKMYIQYGVAALAFAKTTAALANPLTAKGAAIKLIAIGAVLSAVGGAIGSIGSGGGGGGGSISSGGGSSQTPSSSVSSTSFQAQRESEVVFRIAGTDLLGVLRRAEGQENRLG
jgi:hypothetical protein